MLSKRKTDIEVNLDQTFIADKRFVESTEITSKKANEKMICDWIAIE